MDYQQDEPFEKLFPDVIVTKQEDNFLSVVSLVVMMILRIRAAQPAGGDAPLNSGRRSVEWGARSEAVSREPMGLALVQFES